MLKKKMKIKKVGVLSLGKIFAVMYFVLGLIFGVIMSLVSVATLIFSIGSSAGQGIIGAIMGIGAIIFMPLFYGAMGFVFGVISAAIYNFVASKFGGLELEFE